MYVVLCGKSAIKLIMFMITPALLALEEAAERLNKLKAQRDLVY